MPFVNYVYFNTLSGNKTKTYVYKFTSPTRRLSASMVAMVTKRAPLSRRSSLWAAKYILSLSLKKHRRQPAWTFLQRWQYEPFMQTCEPATLMWVLSRFWRSRGVKKISRIAFTEKRISALFAFFGGLETSRVVVFSKYFFANPDASGKCALKVFTRSPLPK